MEIYTRRLLSLVKKKKNVKGAQELFKTPWEALFIERGPDTPTLNLLPLPGQRLGEGVV